jgi:hypothetical protein
MPHAVGSDQLDKGLHAEAGERQDAVVVETVVLDVHFEGDIVKPVDIFAEFLGDAVDGLDVRDLVDVDGQAARTATG